MCVAGFNTTQRGLWAKHSNEEAAAAAAAVSAAATSAFEEDVNGDEDDNDTGMIEVPGLDNASDDHDHGEEGDDSFLDVGSPNRCVFVFCFSFSFLCCF